MSSLAWQGQLLMTGLCIGQALPVALAYASCRVEGKWLTGLAALGFVALFGGRFLFLVMTLATSGVTA